MEPELAPAPEGLLLSGCLLVVGSVLLASPDPDEAPSFLAAVDSTGLLAAEAPFDSLRLSVR